MASMAPKQALPAIVALCSFFTLGLASQEASCASDFDLDGVEAEMAVSMLQTQLAIDEASLRPSRHSASLREVLSDAGAAPQSKGALSEALSRASSVGALDLASRQLAYKCAMMRLEEAEGVPSTCMSVTSAAMLAAVQDPPASEDQAEIASRQAWMEASEKAKLSMEVSDPTLHSCALHRLESAEPVPKECLGFSPAALLASLQTAAGTVAGTKVLADVEAADLQAVEQVPGLSEGSVNLPFPTPPNASAPANATSIASATASALEAPGFSVWGALILTVIAMLAAKWLVAKSTYREMPDSRYVAEFAGTFMLAFVATACSLIGSTVLSVFAIALAVMVITYGLGPVSEGHINPAVTFAYGLTRKMTWETVCGYWLSQFMGAFAAACAAQVLLGSGHPSGTYPPADKEVMIYVSAAIYEVVYSTLLCFAFLNCSAAVRNKENQFYAMAVAAAVGAGLIHGQHAYGAFLNPAVAIGYDVSTLHDGIGLSLLWSLADFVGAFVAALLFGVLRPEDFMLEVDQVLYERPLWRKCLAEFYGVFTVMVTLGAFAVPEIGEAATVAVALSLVCLIYSLGEHSGGHFNPSVTLACMLTGRDVCPAISGICYIFSQCFGAALGGMLSVALRMNSDWPLRTMTPGAGQSLLSCGITEVIYTFLIAYVVLCTATAGSRDSPKALKSVMKVSQQHGNFYFAFAIGSCVVAGIASGAVSGGVMNPALSVGMFFGNLISLNNVGQVFINMLVFAAWQFLGSVVAQLVFYITYAHEYDTELPKLGARDTLALYTCEFVGTFVLAFSAAMCTITGHAGWSALSVGATLMVAMYATCPVSNGHLNPAVTLALLLTKKVDSARIVVGYWIMQFLGGIAGCLLGCLLVRSDINGSITEANANYYWYQAILMEVLYTFAIVFAVLNCCASVKNNPKQESNHFFALAAALSLGAGATATGGICHATFNPAVGIGMEIGQLGKGYMFGWSFAWTVAQFVGGMVAAGVFHIVRPEDFEPIESLDAYIPKIQAQCVSEFVGTFMLCITVGLCLVTAQGGITAVAAASILASMIYSLGNISGAHLNPAVTVAVVASGRDKCSVNRAMGYMVAQFLAGLCAGGISWLCLIDSIPTGLAISSGNTLAMVGFVELMATFLLAYTVLSCATVPIWPVGFTNYYFALCIGMCVVIGGNSIGSVSGGELNPAVSCTIWLIGALGGSTLSGLANFSLFIVLALWELAGGLMAACVFFATHPAEYKAYGVAF